jgi:hypothetical protein
MRITSRGRKIAGSPSEIESYGTACIIPINYEFIFLKKIRS